MTNHQGHPRSTRQRHEATAPSPQTREGRLHVHRGRFTAQSDTDFVVFLIGMRVNKPFKIHKWWPVAAAMPKMLRAIDEHPELGCLGQQHWMGRTSLLVQYWRDFESLDRFAGSTGLPHLAAWRRFNHAVRDSDAVGIWHETYRVHASDYEAVYVNMPAFGLAAATRHATITPMTTTAASRLGMTTDDRLAGRRAPAS